MSSDLKVTNIKHESSSSNNLVLASDGTTTVSGALTASGGIKVADGGNIGSASDADAISISSTGIVTQSALPYFRAYGNGATTTVANGSRLPLNLLSGTDQGMNYSTTGFYFITPVTGVYLICLQYYQYEGNSALIVYNLYHSDNDSSFSNETYLGRIRIDATESASDHMYYYSQPIKINANKRVYWENASGGGRDHYQNDLGHTTFSATLLG